MYISSLPTNGQMPDSIKHNYDNADVVQRQKPFLDMLAQYNLCPLRATGLEVMQINVGKLCNQSCQARS